MAAERSDFLRDIIDADLAAGRHQRVATRFPPEPNGYLHIGHAKSICLNFGIARDYQGTCNLRYDDTNPAKEDIEYVESIEADVRWLGFPPSAVLFSADYFPRMYELAERLVREGKAYVCDLTDEQIKEYRGSLTEPGTPSPNRDRSVDENLALLRKMKSGELPDGACTLRAKIDMASANMKMRDPLLYRIRHAHHHRTGDQWCIYPMYDYAHPLEDGIEGITHSICTLEFENNRELYDWVLDHTGPWNPRPHQYEFARLALEYTVMSKRKLLQLVEGKHVNGWDDPRMPTIAGMRRRGIASEAIRKFCDMIGIDKTNSMVDIAKFDVCVRDELNHNARRALGVLHPIEVELVGLSEPVRVEADDFPKDIGKPGSRPLDLGSRIYIDRDDWSDEPPKDWKRLAPGRTVRLRYGVCITAEVVSRRGADGSIEAIRATAHMETLDGTNPTDRKVSGVIHWVDAATSVPAEFRLYDRLTTSAKPEEGGGNFLDQLSPESLTIVHGRVEPALASAKVGERFQLERLGYFRVDEDTKPGGIVLNRTISLHQTVSAKAEARARATASATGHVLPSEPGTISVTGGDATMTVGKPKNAKAATRPKSKSPHEYRTEARARDPQLAEAFDRFKGLAGVTEAQADLLSGDRTTAEFFDQASDVAGLSGPTATWMVNELPRALGGGELADSKLAAHDFGKLIVAIAAGKVVGPGAKAALAELVAGKRFEDLTLATVDAGAIDQAIEAVLAANVDKAEQYKAGKTGLLGFLVGQVMKAAPGANPGDVNAALRARLG